MKRVEVKLDLTNVAPLLDVLKNASDALSNRLALPLETAGVEAESLDQWTMDLVASQNDDIAVLLSLFNREFFSEETVVFDEANAEAVVRACSALKLYLFYEFLADLDEEDFEADEVVFDILTERQQKPFLAFMFLDTVQKLIMRHLNESLLDG
jgi:site-specific recombinase XerD